MIWDLDERESRIRVIKNFLEQKEDYGSAGLFPKSELSDGIIKNVLEQEKKDLLKRIIKDENGNWIGIINTHFTPDFTKEEEEK